MRDAFAVHAEAVAAEMNVRTGDRDSFLQLIPADLEFQATILLRKRFELVKRALPRTCRDLGEQAWPEFQRYARACWPSGARVIAQDALGFCAHLHPARNGVVCPLERQRARFVSESNRFAIRYVRTPRMTGTVRGALHVFVRHSPSRWHEWLLYVGV
ncbi:MAG: hypothetical protein NTV51_21485 [Verrucomicrobia bacterium]|nr:hypothetical protein [Verrucomicrobiota bacterium]